MSYEQQLLGALIKSPQHISTLSVKLGVDDLSIPEHKKIYQKVLELHTSGKHLDFFIVSDSFPETDDRVHKALESLRSVEESDVHSIERLIAYVKESSAIDKLKRIGADLINSDNYKGKDVSEIITASTRRIFELAESKRISEVTPVVLVDQMKYEMEHLKGKELWGFPTGIDKVDKATKGMQPGQIWVVGAYTSVGKSWFCLHTANQAHNAGARVLYLSTEMVEKRLGWRFVTMNTGIKEYDILRGELTPEQHERVNASLEVLRGGSFKMVSDIIHVDEAIFYIKREIAKQGVDIVVVDFLQNLASGRDEYEELSNAIRKLQTTAIQDNVCIMVASQVSRESMKSGLGGSFGYKGSGTIEACADVGINLYKDQDPRNIVVDIKKNRNGVVTDTVLEADFAYGRLTAR